MGEIYEHAVYVCTIWDTQAFSVKMASEGENEMPGFKPLFVPGVAKLGLGLPETMNETGLAFSQNNHLPDSKNFEIL